MTDLFLYFALAKLARERFENTPDHMHDNLVEAYKAVMLSAWIAKRAVDHDACPDHSRALVTVVYAGLQANARVATSRMDALGIMVPSREELEAAFASDLGIAETEESD